MLLDQNEDKAPSCNRLKLAIYRHRTPVQPCSLSTRLRTLLNYVWQQTMQGNLPVIYENRARRRVWGVATNLVRFRIGEAPSLLFTLRKYA